MAKRLKRAFTIVELVIVIAVIAILAAVLIPTFTTLIDKANESNDIALVKNLNTALVSKEATDEVNTMQDALDAAYEYGYTVDKLTPSSSGDIVWDEVNNRFALVNEKKEVVFEDGAKPLTRDATKTWKIVTELKGTQDCSWYVGGLSKEAIEGFKFTMGVDTGSVEANVNYASDSTQNVTIRTAGGALTVNAKNATVSHYGTAQSVDVQAVDGKNSYHEYEKVTGNLTITKGHVVFESTAVVNTFVVAEKATEVTATVNDKAQVLTAVAKDNNILTGLNLPATVETVVAEMDDLAMFAGGAGTEKSPYQIATAGQFRNINSVSSANQTYFLQTAVIDLETPAGSVVVSTFNGYYNGGDFYINHSFSTQGSIATIFNTVISGVFENVNYNLVPTDTGYGESAILVFEAGKLEFNDVDVYGTIRYSYNGRNQSPYIYNGNNVLFKDCDANINIYTELYSSVFVGYPMAGQKYAFEDCTFNGEIVGSQVALLFANNSQFSKDTTIVTVKNVVNNGTIMGYTQAGLVFAEGSTSNEEEISSNIVSNNKVITVTPLEGFSVSVDSSKKITVNQPESVDVAYYTVVINEYVTWYYKTNIGYGKGSTMTGITKTYTADEIKNLDLYAYEFRQTSQGLNNAVVDSDTVKYALTSGDYTVVTKDFAEHFDIVEVNGQKYYLLNKNTTGANDEEYLVISSPVPTVKVYAYNAEGDLLGIAQA